MEEVVNEMNEMQKRFVDFYCQSGNATQSAIKAGYSEKTARSQGQRLLTNVDIKNAIEERNKQLEDERIADMAEIKRFWTSMFRNPESDPKDQLKATELLVRTKGGFIDKQESTINGELGIKVLWADDDDRD